MARVRNTEAEGEFRFSKRNVVPFKVDAWSGYFSAHISGEHLSAKTKDELEQKVKRALMNARVRIAEPLTIINIKPHKYKTGFMGSMTGIRWDGGVGVRHVLCTGKNMRTGRLLLRDEERNEAVSSNEVRRASVFTKRLNADDIETYTRLRKALDEATKAYEAWEAKVRIDDPEDYIGEKLGEQKSQGDEDEFDDEDPRT